MVILDLCGGTGAWSRPYADAGYRVEVVDLLADGRDVRLLQRIRAGVHGILAAPTCTKFAVSGNGARAKEKAAGTYDAGIQEALSVVDACVRIAWVTEPDVVVPGESGRHARSLSRPARDGVRSVRLRRSLHEEDAAVGPIHAATKTAH